MRFHHLFHPSRRSIRLYCTPIFHNLNALVTVLILIKTVTRAEHSKKWRLSSWTRMIKRKKHIRITVRNQRMDIDQRQKIWKQWDDMRRRVEECDRAYYGFQQSLMPDEAYDNLRRGLEEYEQRHPFLPQYAVEKVGSQSLSSLHTPRRHEYPMHSLGNIYTQDQWLQSVRSVEHFLGHTYEGSWLWEPKVDGLSLSLVYRDGWLVRAITRGDGRIGEDVSACVRLIPGMPERIAYTSPLTVRCEIYLEKETFVNTPTLQRFSSARHGASGLLRARDTSGAIYLRYGVHGICQLCGYTSYTKRQQWIESLGFCILPHTHHKTAQSIQNAITTWEGTKDTFSYVCDGMVIKVDDLNVQERLGYAGRFPRFAWAYKSKAHTKKTTLQDVEHQVGRTGTITPVGILEPISLDGVCIKRVSLHNYDDVQRRDIRLKDSVYIARSGDVIPYIQSVDYTQNTRHHHTHIQAPKTCPSCGNELHKVGVWLRCSAGFLCQAQAVWRLVHMASKSCFNIYGMGIRRMQFFYDHGYIREPCHIFTLTERMGNTRPHLRDVPGWADQGIKKLFHNIQRARTISLERLILSLGIDGIGIQSSYALAQHYGSWHTFWNMCCTDPWSLCDVDGLGQHVVSGVQSFVSKNAQIVNRLIPHLVIEDMAENDQHQGQSQNLFYEKNIVITGTLTNTTRQEAKERIRRWGGRIKSTLSQPSDILLCGQKPGSKYEKAINLGCTIIDDETWQNMI